MTNDLISYSNILIHRISRCSPRWTYMYVCMYVDVLEDVRVRMKRFHNNRNVSRSTFRMWLFVRWGKLGRNEGLYWRTATAKRIYFVCAL